MTDDRPRYMISIAAELVGMHPQTLRIYETKGLVRPQRTGGNTRLYSDDDLQRASELLTAALRPARPRSARPLPPPTDPVLPPAAPAPTAATARARRHGAETGIPARANPSARSQR